MDPTNLGLDSSPEIVHSPIALDNSTLRQGSATAPKFPIKFKILAGILIFSGLSLGAVALNFAIANRKVNTPRDRNFNQAYLEQLQASQNFDETVFSYDYGGGILTIEKAEDRATALGQLPVTPGYLQVLQMDEANNLAQAMKTAIAQQPNSDCYKKELATCTSYRIADIRTQWMLPALASVGQQFSISSNCESRQTQKLINELKAHIAGLQRLQVTVATIKSTGANLRWLTGEIEKFNILLKAAEKEIDNRNCQPLNRPTVLALSAFQIGALIKANATVTANNLNTDPKPLTNVTAFTIDAFTNRLSAEDKTDAAAEMELLGQQKREAQGVEP